MKINTTIVAFSDIGRLLAAVEKCGVTPPRELTDVPRAAEKLAAATPIANPVEELLTAALDGRATPDKVDRALERTALAKLIAAERVSLDQRIGPELLQEFGRRLDNGGCDACLDLLRPQFTAAADTLSSARATIDLPSVDPQTFLDSARGAQLAAWQSLRPALSVLDRISLIAAAFGPGGAFAVVADPRQTDAGLRCGWLHDIGVMCCGSGLLQSCAAFQRPHPIGDVPSSPWLRVTPHLHSVSSAAERLRVWAESAWAAQESECPKGGRLVDGVVVSDPPRRNPFTLEEANAS
jgi:hypothetical protein